MRGEEPPEYKVQMVCCPACGGQIKETAGPCGFCDQLVIVTKNHKPLVIKKEDIKDIPITPPTNQELTEKNLDAEWTVGNSWWKQSALMVLSGGEPEYGAQLVAFYYAKNPDKALPGQRVPKIDQIEMFSLATAIQQSIKK